VEGRGARIKTAAGSLNVMKSQSLSLLSQAQLLWASGRSVSGGLSKYVCRVSLVVLKNKF